MTRFFVIDGIDGAGKSTQTALLAEVLGRDGFDVVKVRDPGGTDLSDRIRALLLNPGNHAMAPAVELCLYAAARAQLVHEVVRPALEAGKVVVSDRFTWSTHAYQGSGRGLSREQIAALEEIACGGIRPAHVFVLDLPAEQRTARLGQKGGAPDRLESESDAFFRRVRAGFLALARERPGQGTVLDASGSAEVVHGAILAKVREILS